MLLEIRKAEERDMDGIMNLLHQVNDVHAAGRPDLFIEGKTKYTEIQLAEILRNPQRPVFVGIDEDNHVAGYCFCVVKDTNESVNLVALKTLYIDDLCVDERCRGQHVGRSIYSFVRNFASENGFYNITLNVWNCNPVAMRFYESLGMSPMKVTMEDIICG